MGHKRLVAATLLLAEDINLEKREQQGEAGPGWKHRHCTGPFGSALSVTWSPHLCLHLLMRLDGPWLGHDQATPQVLSLQASDQGSKVVTCLCPLQTLVEHLNA